jgi:hypothetical protein
VHLVIVPFAVACEVATSTQVLGPNPRRRAIVWNGPTTTGWIQSGGTAAVNTGIRLSTSGPPFVMEFSVWGCALEMPFGGITAGGPGVISGWELVELGKPEK